MAEAADGRFPEVWNQAQKEHVSPYSEEKEHHLPKASAIQHADEIGTHREKRVWVPLVLLLLIAAVVGGTVGPLSARSHTSNSQVPTPLPSSTPTAKPSTAPPPTAQTPTAPPPTAQTPPTQTPSSSPLNSSLASVSWTDKEGLGYRRLYYQDPAGVIKESAWNSTARQWYSSSEELGKAKLNTPLAAAAAGNRTGPFQLNLYYVDLSGNVVELYTKDGHTWATGRLTSERIMPAPNSDLAATWTKHAGSTCNDCGEQALLLAYEDSDNHLWVYNSTSSGPRWLKLDAGPTPGSGLAGTLQWRSLHPAGIRLYYQRGEHDLCSVDWEPQDGLLDTAGQHQGWTLHENAPTGRATSGAPMASFSWGIDDNDFGDPFMIDVLSSSPHGVKLHWWGGQTRWKHWQELGEVDVMKDVQAYSALAANVDRHVYALENGVVREFVVSADGQTWSVVGDVPIKN